MQYSLIALVVTLGTIAITHPTYAAEKHVPPSNTSSGQAADLVIEPIKITGDTGNSIYQTNELNKVANSIPAARQEVPQRINPFDLLTDPSTTLKRLSQQGYDQKQEPIEPLGFFKVPPLESGISVRVGQF